MALFLAKAVFLLQPDATNALPGGGAAPAGGGGGAPSGGGGYMQFVILAVMFAVFYFLLIRPQQKRQKEMDAMLKSLRKGDKVRTSGGIRGEIVELTDTEVTVLVADKVKLNVLRTHIASKIVKPGEDGAASS